MNLPGCHFGYLCLCCCFLVGCATSKNLTTAHPAEKTSIQTDSEHTQDSQTLSDSELSQTSESEPLSSEFAKAPEELAACFVSGQEILSENFVLSSVQIVELSEHKLAILAELSNGNIQLILMQENGEVLLEKRIASLAQLSCAESWKDGFRIGIIERDPLKATYSLGVLSFDDQGVQVPDADWRATTRGFMPDPGSKCGFLGERDMIVTGIRPRADKPPYHGMFTLQTSSLKLFEETRIHVPEIVAVWKNGEEFRVLTREVKTAEEGGQAFWPHILYRLTLDGDLEVLEENDFIVPYDEFVPGITRAGCYIGRDNHSYCVESESEIQSVLSVRGVCGEYPEESCMIWEMQDGHQKLVRMPAMEQPQSLILPGNMRFFSYPSTRRYAQWLVSDVDEKRPDIGHGLRFVAVDSKCLW